jgi:hypothetical protein
VEPVGPCHGDRYRYYDRRPYDDNGYHRYRRRYYD